ncbi:MAG: gliding motility-associated protein GldE [Porphyromonadaceae bacterium]|nr:MAG: gliding motility-associated protein GldE [Porphyromonadaceae bacterium]
MLLAASALISGAEVAFFSIGPNERNQLNLKTNKKAKRVLTLLVKPEDLLATLLVTNNLVNMGIVILSTWVTDSLLSFMGYPVLKFIIQIVLITFVILLIGEVLPKIYATRHSLRLAQLMSIPVLTLERMLRPVNRVLIGSTSLVRKRLKDQSAPLTMDELSEALVLTGQELVEEEKILKGIVRFGNIEVGEIMRPRVDIFSLDIREPFRAVFDRMIELGYSRFPVYQKDLDDIRGILYVKDLLSHVQKTNSFRWQSLIRPAFFVPDNKRINDLLQEFRQNKMHMAIVVDEYGGTSGLITLEDILEEIVGEIRDESDEEDTMIQKIGEKSYLCNGKTSLHDLVKVLELDEDYFEQVKGGSETLAGLILELKGEIPEPGARIQLNYLTFVIKSRDDRRIKEIEIRIA